MQFSQPRTQNLAHMLKLYAILLIPLIFIISVVGYGIYNGVYLPLYITVGAVLFNAGNLYFKKRKIDAKLKALFQQPDPQAIINWHYQMTKSALLADGQYLRAYFAGMTQAMYGNFQEAQLCLTSVEWKERPPMIQALGLLLDAVLDFLARQNYQAGKAKISEANHLIDLPDQIPGKKTSQFNIQAYFLASKLFSNPEDIEAAVRLNSLLPKLLFLEQIFASWVLARTYNQQGNAAGYEQMATFLKQNAPYCKGLTLDT